MSKSKSAMADRVGEVASRFQQQRTGYAPKGVTVVLSDATLVITLHGALTPAEQAMSTSPAGAARVQEFHRQLFANSSAELRAEIARITGVEVNDAAGEVETTGAVAHAFRGGTMVQIFLMAGNVSAEKWGAASVTD